MSYELSFHVPKESSDARTIESEKERLVIEKAISLRLKLLENLELYGTPNRNSIAWCRDIIALFKNETPAENVDRSHRFQKSAKQRLIKKFGNGCAACGKGVSGGNRHAPILEIHHIIPREFGGNESIENGLPFCRACHSEVHI